MNSSAESRVEVYVSDKMLKELEYLLPEHGPKGSCGIILKDYLENFDVALINDIYMKEQAIFYYIEGPAWHHDNTLLQRSWLKGFEAACTRKGKPFTLRFNIDQYCISKLQKSVISDDD